MFTLSVVIGSSILYKDFNAASPQRLLKFIFGCISTFIGVYLITLKRPLSAHPRPLKHRPSIPHYAQAIPHYPSNPHLRPDPDHAETAPLLMIPSPVESPSAGLGETPPQFLGTSFGYHFANPRHGGASTLPRERRPRDDLASAIWSRWRHATEPPEEPVEGGRRLDLAGRSQSEGVATGQGEGLWRDTASEGSGDGATSEERGSWGRNRGYSVV